MALVAYRHLLRATRIAFQDDSHVLLSARHQARSSFSMNSLLAPTSTEAIEQIKHAEEVTRILRQNVVQGERVSGKESQERYHLRLHRETERGDNESIKKAGKGGMNNTAGCCGKGI